MIVLFQNNPVPTRRILGPTARTMASLSLSSMVPAHGFVVSRVGRGASSSLGSWMRTFLGACAWAFMIAAGSLVYSHFVKKWQSSGLPMLPVAAMVTQHQQQQQQGQSSSQSAGGLPSGTPQFQRARPPGQSSFMAEYEV